MLEHNSAISLEKLLDKDNKIQAQKLHAIPTSIRNEN